MIQLFSLLEDEKWNYLWEKRSNFSLSEKKVFSHAWDSCEWMIVLLMTGGVVLSDVASDQLYSMYLKIFRSAIRISSKRDPIYPLIYLTKNWNFPLQSFGSSEKRYFRQTSSLFCVDMAEEKGKALIILAEGNEEMEAVITADVLRRGKVRLLFIKEKLKAIVFFSIELCSSKS